MDAISIVDLFSGTGNIAFEFASRGTSKIHAVDGNYNCVKFINKISTEFNFPINAFKSDVFKFLEKTVLTTDIIFADPPYNMDKDKFLKIIALVFERQLLNENGMLIIEHSKHMDLSENNFFSYWPYLAPESCINFRRNFMIRFLKKNKYLNLLTKVFQRRFRQELINGKIDKECLLISQNLAKKLN